MDEPNPPPEALTPDVAASALAAPPELETRLRPLRSPSRRPRTPKLQALAEMAICSSMPTQLAIGWALRLAGWSPGGRARSTATGLRGRVVTLADTAALVGLMVLLMRAHGERPSALWLGEPPVVREALPGMLHIPIVFLIGPCCSWPCAR